MFTKDHFPGFFLIGFKVRVSWVGLVHRVLSFSGCHKLSDLHAFNPLDLGKEVLESIETLLVGVEEHAARIAVEDAEMHVGAIFGCCKHKNNIISLALFPLSLRFQDNRQLLPYFSHRPSNIFIIRVFLVAVDHEQISAVLAL